MDKPTYEELEQRVKGLEKEILSFKQIENALRESEATLRSIFRAAPTGIGMVCDRVIKQANGRLCEMLGYSREELLGKSARILYPTDEDFEYVGREKYAQIGERGTGAVETRWECKDGRVIDVLLSSAPVDHNDLSIGVTFTALDITGRKQTEKALRESENRFRRAINEAPFPIMIHAEGGEVLQINEVWMELTGYSRSEISTISEWTEKAYGVRKDLVKEDIDKLYNLDTRVKEGEYNINTSNGNVITWDFSSAPLGNLPDGRLLVISMATDVTERKRTEEALRLSEERYRKFIENAPVGMYTINLKGEFTYGNRKLLEITGYKAEDWLNKSFHPIIYPDDLDILLDKIQKRFAGLGTTEPYEIRVFHASGKPIWIKITSESIYETDEKGGKRLAEVQSFVEDITDRKRAEEALRQERDRAQMYLDIAEVIFMALDAEGNVASVNKKGCGILGYSEKEMLGRNWFDNFLHHEQRDQVKDVFQQLMKGLMEPVEYYENPIITKSGEVRYIAWHNTILKNAKGDIIGTFSSGEDITERMLAEEETRKLEVRLQQAQKMEAIGTLAGGIAHDFNNILSPIMIHTEMARMDILPNSPLRLNLEEIYKAGERARDLVKQILTFSRQSEQKQSHIKISPIVKEALKFLRSTLPSTIEIRQSIRTKSDIMFADSIQIHQVLMNLCTNAAHAMRETGGVLEVRLTDEMIDSEMSARIPNLNPGAYLKLTVRDSGHGIDPMVIDRVFDPYFTTKETGEGSGLGLAVVHGIVASCGGAITIDSESGKGTTCYVYFPKSERDLSPETERAPYLPEGNETLLVVDDEKTIVEAIQTLLERLGYKVVGRTGSVEALEVFLAQPDAFDMVITDMTMPRMTGAGLAKEVKKARPDVPIIICTGFSEMINEDKAKKMGIRALVMKPIVMSEMANTIRKVLDEK